MSIPAPQPTDPGYLATLGLQRAPFLDQIDDRFFYADPALVQRLDLLQHLTQFGDMLLGVLGPAGSGKSTLVQQFMLRGSSAWRSCRINAAQISQPGELLTKLAVCFGQDTNAEPERLKTALARHFQSLRHTSQLPVVVIDDAQLLSDTVLKTLLELGGDARETLKLVRILLFAEPGLEQKLTQAGLHSPQQPLLHSLEIPSFDIQQSAAYLMYRLAVAGYSGDSPFSLTEIRALHKATEGQPGKLNVLAHEALMERAGRIAARNKNMRDKSVAATPSNSATPVPARRRRLGILSGVLGLVSLAALSWFLLQSGYLEPPASAPSSREPGLAQQPGAPPPPELSEPSRDEATPGGAIVPAEPDRNGAVEDIADVAEPVEPPRVPTLPEIAEPAPETQTATAEDSPPEAAAPIAPPVEPTAAATTPPAASPTTVADIDTPEAAQSQAPAPQDPPPLTSPEEPSAQQPAAGNESPATIAQSVPAPMPIHTPPPQPSATEAASPLREDWLQERPATHYTLQLLGVRSETSLRNYLTMHKPSGPVAFFRTQYKGGEWYVLVQGDYPTMAAAREAIASLPAAIRKGKPWPRSFASVHADMDKAGPRL